MQYIIIGHDGTDSEAPARRAAARPDHIARGEELRQAGILWYGAALLAADGSMNGSMYLVDVTDEAALQQLLADEPYIQGDVWRSVETYPCNVRDPAQFNRPADFFGINIVRDDIV